LEQRELVRELFLGETPAPSEQGQIQIISESSYFGRTRNSDGQEASFALGVSYGVTDCLELGITFPAEFAWEDGDSNSGFAGLELEALYCFCDLDDFTLSIAGTVTVPPVNPQEGVGSDALQFEPEILAACKLGPAQLFGQLGLNLEAGAKAGLIYSTAIAAPLGPGAGVLELAGSAASESELYVVPGYAIEFGHGWELDVGVPIGLTEHSREWGVVVKLSYEFP